MTDHTCLDIASEVEEKVDSESHVGRYLFLLGIVPAIAGSLLGFGLAPLQILLILAYVVTSYLFLIENSGGSGLTTDPIYNVFSFHTSEKVIVFHQFRAVTRQG